MAQKRYFWLKLPKNFFTDKAIKRMRKIAGGDTYTIIYLKMLLAAMQQDGKLFYEGIEDDIYNEIALEIDEDPENVKVAVNYLVNVGYVVMDPDGVTMERLPEMIGSEGASAERMRKSRAKKAAALGAGSPPKIGQNNEKVSHCDASVTNSDTEKEREKEKDIDTERETKGSPAADPGQDPAEAAPKNINYQAIADLYNSICRSLPAVKTLSESRKKAIRARIRTGYTLDDFREAFQMAENSDFMKGKNARNWRADFDWIMKDANITKILEGKYLNNGQQTAEPENGSRYGASAYD